MNGYREEDAELFDAIREMWDAADPVPDGLAERMVAAVAAEGIGDELELLDIVEDARRAEVRARTDLRTLQFADGDTSLLLLHIAPSTADGCRIDGWSDPPVASARLCQEAGERTAEADEGVFSFVGVPQGRSRVHTTVRSAGGTRETQTPWFEV